MNISASRLAEVAAPNFCPRCFWVKLKMGWEVPFELEMPSVFRAIHEQITNIVHAHYVQTGRLPRWFPNVGTVKGLEGTLHWSKFSFTHPKFEITLRGQADDIFRMEIGYHIADYKTARYTETQQQLLPQFEAQLNAYAYISEHGRFFSPVTGLSLIYLDPDPSCDLNQRLASDLLIEPLLGFNVKAVVVQLKPDSFTENLLERVAEIASFDSAPTPMPSCGNCRLIKELGELTSLSLVDLLVLERELTQLPDFSNGWTPLEVQLVRQKVASLLSNLKQKMGL